MQKAQTMYWGWPVERERCVVRASAVPFVPLKAVRGESFGKTRHAAVTLHFRRDGGERNRQFLFVAVDNRLLILERCRRFEPAVQKHAACGGRYAEFLKRMRDAEPK